jgi:ABC-type sulfate transport system permease component
VFGGTLSSLVIYAMVGNNLLRYINQYVHIDVVKKWGAIIVGLLIVVFLIYHFKTVKAFLDEEDGEE